MFVPAELPRDCLQRLEAVADLSLRTEQLPPSEDEMLRRLPGHDACIPLLTYPMTRQVLETASASPDHPLKLVAQVAVGIDNIDLDATRQLGIPVAHTPGVLTEATADLTMALMLATTRRIVEADRFLRDGSWSHWSLHLLSGLQLQGARLGILGLGRIGTAVARRARAFGMKILFTTEGEVPEDVVRELEAERRTLPQLLAESDVLTVHAPLTDSTHHILDRDALFAMKEGAYLVNTARGGLVDETVLAEALEDGPLAGVGLDVYADEPSVPASLVGRDDIVLLPHIGS
ncbi:MAG TPA: D-glycerate dehydrogenase, partial [Deltaproteobacteria bacterium]|nr:D-glycerate dehydrogenase [Deltaproteobacteria bacterium]